MTRPASDKAARDQRRATLRWDDEADACYLDLAPDSAGERTSLFSPDERILADVLNGQLVGIEILGASTHPLLFMLIPRGVSRMELIA